ncbi:hypothetical protein FSARC_3776 [Fusarium sarcochroum]|uniref:Protection of telomeres protein 1 n=1 Tax=Fusarium sarcochroum TaxID=1208366 RepID=A0A8H4U3N8_9HYPO|nr:hypothetical protein FSARC_3776 [Fusarium sarcochroum]
MPPPSSSTLPGYTPIRDILDGKVHTHSFANVVGVVVDFRTPIATRGADWKCQVRLYDSSIDDEDSVSLNIFRPKKDMPTAGCGDVMLIRSVKVQHYGSEMPSLLTNRATKISIYEASKIPKPPNEASCALRPPSSPKDLRPDGKENAFVAHMYNNISRDRIPAEIEFESMVLTSANVREKFCLLQDVEEGRFCDIVAQVVRPWYDGGDKITLWVSDYTENSVFHHFQFNTEVGRDGDPYGYTDKFTSTASTSDWPGPFGKRCMQVTCWEPHATAIRELKIEPLTWVLMRNVQIKMGHSGANLEGFLREDRGAFGTKIGIQPLDLSSNSENIDPRAIEALRRKRDYERKRKGQLKEIIEASKAGQKRKSTLASEPESKSNAKTKRKAKRAKARANKQDQVGEHDQLNEQAEEDTIHVVDVNPQVKCENQDKPANLIAEITEFVQHKTTIDGQDIKIPLPFVNLNHRANVRVVNFSPSSIVDFVRPRKESEMDILSDDGEESPVDSDSEDEDEQTQQMTIEDFTKPRKWEWRFFLELEDAAVSDKQERQRLWVAVDNQSAQCLTSLDASNLRRDEKTLTALREKMWLLWGNLEEKKMAAQEAAKKGQPPCDSDDEDQQLPETTKSGKAQLSNRAFPCCIQQYGIKVPEPNQSKADAGDGKRWQRMFRLFGARIVS